MSKEQYGQEGESDWVNPESVPQPTTPLPGYPPLPQSGGQEPAYNPYGPYNSYAPPPVSTPTPYGPPASLEPMPYAQPPVPQYANPKDARRADRAARRAYRHQMRAEQGHRMSFVWPLLLISAGVIFLLNNVGILDWSVWDSIWRLWPLGLIIFGVDMLVGKRRPALSLVLTLALVGVGAAILYYTAAFAPTGVVVQRTLAEPLNGAPAQVEINMDAGNLHIGNSNGGELAVGSLDYFEKSSPPEVHDEVTSDSQSLTIKQTHSVLSSPLLGAKGRLRWDINLSGAVPIGLNIDSGTGTTKLDLTHLKVTKLDLKIGAGSTEVLFPEGGQATDASIDGGAGSLDVTIPAGQEAKIKVDTGVGGVSVNPRFKKQGDNVYQTAGYGNAQKKLDLDINVGVGQLTIK